ncbi:hypothetical protein ABPG77_002414 [Micractinium sp. CCAP 211/92]
MAAAAGWQRQRHQPAAALLQAVWLQQRRHSWARCVRLRALHVEAPSEALSVEAAWALLEDFTQREARGLAQPLLDAPEKRRRLRDALLVAAAAPYAPAGWNPEAAASSSAVPEVLLGVVASDVRLAVRSLRDYCQALGLPFQMPESRVPGVAAAPALVGPVYIKYNAATGLCYATKRSLHANSQHCTNETGPPSPSPSVQPVKSAKKTAKAARKQTAKQAAKQVEAVKEAVAQVAAEPAAPSKTPSSKPKAAKAAKGASTGKKSSSKKPAAAAKTPKSASAKKVASAGKKDKAAAPAVKKTAPTKKAAPAKKGPAKKAKKQPAAAPAAPAAAVADTPGRGLIGGIVGACSAAVAALKRRLSTAA